MTNLNLYQEVILDHNKKPRNWGVLENCTHFSEGINPLCGDHIHLSLIALNNQIKDMKFNGESCAICKASASIMTESTIGKTFNETELLISIFRKLTTGDKLPYSLDKIGKIKIFSGIKNLPSRVKCAVLPWHTLYAAMNSEHSVSTEGSHDPFSGEKNA